MPVVRMFSTSWCPHCAWSKPIFKKAVTESENEWLIKSYMWEIDTSDNLLTKNIEFMIPQAEVDFYNTNNPLQKVPYFNFGCIYERIGNGYEAGKNAAAEENEFRLVLDKLIARLINK